MFQMEFTKDKMKGTIFVFKKDLQITWAIKLKGTKRTDIKSGMRVLIVLKKDQRSGKLTEGIVKDVLTNSPNHHHGIKVRLRSGKIGRVKKIVSF